MKKHFHRNRKKIFFTVSITMCVVVLSIGLSTSCLGRTADLVKKNTNTLTNNKGKARSVFINYPINLTRNTVLAQTIQQDLKAHFNSVNQHNATVAVYTEEDIKKAHLFMQITLQDELWDEKRKVLIWQLELTLKENGTKRYYLRSNELRIRVAAPMDGDSYRSLHKSARKKLKAALDYFFVYRKLPAF